MATTPSSSPEIGGEVARRRAHRRCSAASRTLAEIGSQPPKTRSSSSARGTNSRMSGLRPSSRLPRRMWAIWVSEPIGRLQALAGGDDAGDEGGGHGAQAGGEDPEAAGGGSDVTCSHGHNISDDEAISLAVKAILSIMSRWQTRHPRLFPTCRYANSSTWSPWASRGPGPRRPRPWASPDPPSVRAWRSSNADSGSHCSIATVADGCCVRAWNPWSTTPARSWPSLVISPAGRHAREPPTSDGCASA